MVRFVPELTTIEDLDQALKLENLEEDPLESKSYDYSFADGLLDFDSIKVWFENSTDLTPVMAADGEKVKVEEGLFSGEAQIGCGSSPIVDGMAPGPIGKVERVELEEEVGGLRGPSIVEGMEKFSLAAAGENGVKSEKMCDREDKREGSSSSCSSSSSDNDDDEKEEVREKENVNVKRGVVDMVDDVEEGEIRDGNDYEDEDNDDEEEDDEIVKADQMVAWSDVDEDDEEDGAGAKAGPILSKNELKVLPPVPPVLVTLQPHHQTQPVGVILSMVGSQVIVEGIENHNPLNEGSILWITESRSPLGLIDEIFGPVKNPYYIVRYNSENEVPKGIKVCTSISFVPEFADHVLNTNKDLYKKGYDASGANDEEISDEAEFSDDEREAEYKKMHKMAKRAMNDQKNNRKKKNGDKQWNNGNNSNNKGQGSSEPLRNQDLHIVDHGSSSTTSSASSQGFFNGSGMIPPFRPPIESSFGPNFNGIWNPGMPFQQQQQQGPMFSNGFPMNGVGPWLSQNPTLVPYQMMPMMNGAAGLTFSHGPGAQQPAMGLCFNPGQVNQVMGPGQFNPFMNPGQGIINPGGLLNVGQSPNLQLGFVIPGNVETNPQFNQGPPAGNGGQPNAQGGDRGGFRGGRGRRGGHFRGGRGRQQPR